VRDSLINVGPLKDFSYGLRINADANATGIAKQSNYELVSTFNVTMRNLIKLLLTCLDCAEKKAVLSIAENEM
jgi:hypothetical protein